MRLLVPVTLLLTILGVIYLMTRKHWAPSDLAHFKPAEFREWWPHMSPDLLKKLDRFRELWGAPITVSPVNGALGRHLGPHDDSQHNIDKWGEVRAIDVFPYGLNAENAEYAKKLAQQAGFSGIGIYSDTRPSWMMHLDVRPDRTASRPATWARVSSRYVGITEVFA